MSQPLHEPLSNLITGAAELIGEGHTDLALWLFTETESLARLTLGDDHPLRARALLGMGMSYDLNGESDLAQRLCGAAIELFPPDDPAYGPALFLWPASRSTPASGRAPTISTGRPWGV